MENPPRSVPKAGIVSSLVLSVLAGRLGADEMTLVYRSRYDCQPGADHLMCAQGLMDNRAIVAGNRGLALIDLSRLPAQGTRDHLFRLGGVNARDIYITDDERYVFVNTHRGETADDPGFFVVRISGDALEEVTTRSEPEVLYEKMCIAGEHLYVTAHSHGIRIFDVSDPEDPVLAGRLDEGFVDAFAIVADGDTAYVADGAGGLKIVDVSDRTSPTLVGGEDLATAEGTSEDVTVRDGRVYVAAGGAARPCSGSRTASGRHRETSSSAPTGTSWTSTS